MATIFGTRTAETLIGTAFADSIWARGGDDALRGLAGADRLDGGFGDDTLLGGRGDDLLSGGPGNDRLDGGPGRDRVDYSQARGGVQVDLISGFAYGAAGDDTLRGIDDAIGSRGDDYLTGDEGTNVLRGGNGNDRLGGDDPLGYYYGRSGSADRLYGGAGNDRLGGGDGDDRLYGGPGDDRLSGGAGDDIRNGGAGRDIFQLNYDEIEPDENFTDSGRDIVEDFVRGEDRISIYTELGSIDSFAEIDTNGSGRLGDGDRYARIESVTYEGTTRASTVIDLSEDAGYSPALVVFGVTGLGAIDFLD